MIITIKDCKLLDLILNEQLTSIIEVFYDLFDTPIERFLGNKIDFYYDNWMYFGSVFIEKVDKLESSKITQKQIEMMGFSNFDELYSQYRKQYGNTEFIILSWSKIIIETPKKPSPTKIDWYKNTDEKLYSINPVVINYIPQDSYKNSNCYYRCSYCYFSPTINRFGNKFKTGFYLNRLLALTQLTGNVNVFIESISDLFQEKIPGCLISFIIRKIKQFNINNCNILFLTKNPERYMQFLKEFDNNMYLGVTLESNSYSYQKNQITLAPDIPDRIKFFKSLEYPLKFISIEPILKFDNEFIKEIKDIKPRFIFLGANSSLSVKLVEPSYDELHQFVKMIKEANIDLHTKENLSRIYNTPQKTLFE